MTVELFMHVFQLLTKTFKVHHRFPNPILTWLCFFFKAPLSTSEGVKLTKRDRFTGGGKEDEISKVNKSQIMKL